MRQQDHHRERERLGLIGAQQATMCGGTLREHSRHEACENTASQGVIERATHTEQCIRVAAQEFERFDSAFFVLKELLKARWSTEQSVALGEASRLVAQARSVAYGGLIAASRAFVSSHDRMEQR